MQLLSLERPWNMQVMEMLSHVNKRLQGQKAIKLPLTALLDQYLNPKASPMTRNFALVYVENAFNREQPAQRFAAVRHHTQLPCERDTLACWHDSSSGRHGL